MGSLSIWHWLFVLVYLSMAIPVAVVFKRVGWSPWLAILAPFPLIGWVLLWVFAFAKWPLEARAAATA